MDEGTDIGWLRGDDWLRILTGRAPGPGRDSSVLDLEPDGEIVSGGWRTDLAACSISPPNLK
jgi:hypothetical protein